MPMGRGETRMRASSSSIVAVTSALLLGACASGSSVSTLASPLGEITCGLNTGTMPEGCAKIEGSQLGQEGGELAIGDVTITFSNWVAKGGESGEFISFDYSVSPSTGVV